MHSCSSTAVFGNVFQTDINVPYAQNIVFLYRFIDVYRTMLSQNVIKIDGSTNISLFVCLNDAEEYWEVTVGVSVES